MASDPLPLEFVLYGKLVYLTAHVWGLVCFLGCQSSWQTAAESQRPPRGSALACPHCLAGDRSDTEANTCSSEEGDLAKRWPLYNPPIHTLDSQHTHSCTHMPNVYHPWQVTWDRTLRSMFPLGTLLPLCSFSFTHSNTQQFVHHRLYACPPTHRGSWIDPAISSHADVFKYRHICGQRGSVIHSNTPCRHAGSDL